MTGWATVVEYLREISIPSLSKINYLRKLVIINVKPVWDKHQFNIRISHKNHYVLPKLKSTIEGWTFVHAY